MAHKKSNTILVREYIRDLIIQKDLKAGNMLPCEGEIAAALDISKSCVREATRALESIGLIEIRHGIGLMLRSFNFDAMSTIFDYGCVLDPSLVLDLYDLRRLLETSLMPRVIENIGSTQIQHCEEILNEWTALAQNKEQDYDADYLFHETLYSVVENRMLTSLCQVFWRTYRDLEGIKRLRRQEGNQYATIEKHRSILEAIKQKNVILASERMFSHFAIIQHQTSCKES